MTTKPIQIFKTMLIVVITSLISVGATSYVYESKEIFHREVHDCRTLAEIYSCIERISELEAGITYKGTLNEEPFNMLNRVRYSFFTYHKVRSICDELDKIRDLQKEPMTQEELNYLKRVSEELHVYLGEFDEYTGNEEFGKYIKRKAFDQDATRLKEIFDVNGEK